MSNLVPTNVQLPAHLSDRMGQPSAISSAMTSGIGGTGGASFKRISIRGSRFRIREGANETILPDNTLRAVIVGASPNITKLFYKGGYNPKAEGEDKKPDCFSNDGIRPDKNASDPQSQQCGNCPQNAWGSKMSDSGNKMKACSDQKRLAVISADDHSENPEVYLFQVTPAALTEFRQYGDMLSSKGFPAELVVTEISFDPKQSFPKAQFKFGGFVNESQVATIDKLVGSDTVKEIVGDQAVAAEVVEQPKPKKPAVTVKAEPAYVPPPVVIEDAEYEDVTPVEAPKPAKGFGAAPSAPKTAAPVWGQPQEPPPAQAVSSSSLTNDIKNILASMEDDDD